MSVVGYDFGNLNSVVAVARHGGIEVLCNDFSLRATPSCVAFGLKSRVMGCAAWQQMNTNLQNTVINFKHLLGRKFSDPIVQLYKMFIPCEVVQTENDGIGIKVNFLGEVKTFSPEQMAAAFFVKLKQITEHELLNKTNECVISVPVYFSDIQVNALIAASRIAGLNVLGLVKENEAAGIAYGLYKNALLPVEPTKLVVIVDIGHSSAQVSLMAFSTKQVEVLCNSSDIELGGLFFDDVIREYFRDQFLGEFGVDARQNKKAWFRLLDESEKVKKQMSASGTVISLSIEYFMDDKDVKGTIKRDQFEELAEPLFAKLRDMLNQFSEDVKKLNINIEDISEVELIGGSTRIPKLKQIIGEHFNVEPKSTMDVDEAVARGVAMQCAILSPTTRVREFTVVNRGKVVIQPGPDSNFAECVGMENEMQAVDLGEKQKADSKNALEEYCYNTSDNLSGSLAMFVTPEEIVNFQSLINQATDWLYGDGENASREDYANQLSSLQSSIDSVINQRKHDLEEKQRQEMEKEQRRVMEEKYRQEKASSKENKGEADGDEALKHKKASKGEDLKQSAADKGEKMQVDS